MLAYILQATLIWTLLLAIYKFLLAREKYFLVNRAYLLTALILGLALPLLQEVQWSGNPIPLEINNAYHTQVELINQWQAPTTINQASKAPLDNNNAIDWSTVLYYIVCAGMAFMVIRFLLSLFSIFKLYRSGEKKTWLYHTEIANKKEHLPFSFLRYVFYSLTNIQEQDKANIIAHELYHVKAKHTWDVLFVELIKIIFWWNPLPYLYKMAIVENHEYAADDHVLKDASRKQYCTLLLQTNYTDLNLPLTHPFFQSFIKKRIKMMYQQKSNPLAYLKILLPLCLIVSMAFVITSQDDKIDRELVLECLKKSPDNSLFIQHNGKVIGTTFEITLASEYFDLTINDRLLQPEVDYFYYPEYGYAVITNSEYFDPEGQTRCINTAEGPRSEEYYERYNQNIPNTKKDDCCIAKERVLPINLDSDYIDLFVGDRLMIPNIDYIYNRKTGEATITNIEYASYWTGACAYVIDEPREASYFNNYNSKDYQNLIFTGECPKPKTYLIIDNDSKIYHNGSKIDIGDIEYISKQYNIYQIKLGDQLEISGDNEVIKEINRVRALDSSIILEPRSNNAYIPSCKDVSAKYYSCTSNKISKFLRDNIKYSEELIKSGFEGLVTFDIEIDDNGTPVSINHVRDHRNPDEELISNEAYYLELIRNEFEFIPASTNGFKHKSHLFVNVGFNIPKKDRKRISIKDSSNIPDNEIYSKIMYISDQGLLRYNIESQWNTPVHMTIIDPNGKSIKTERIEKFYREDGGSFFIPNKINGIYKIKVTQDGQTVETEFLCDVFEN